MPSNFYGFSPQAKNTGSAIADIGAGIGKTIAGLPGQIREKKKYEDAEAQKKLAWEAFQKDKSIIDIQYKVFKQKATEQANQLVKKKALTQEEASAYLGMFEMPRESDKLNYEAFSKYIDRQGAANAKISAKLNAAAKRGAVSAGVGQAVAGREAQVDVMPGGPGETREQATIGQQAPGQVGSEGGAGTIPQAQLMSGRAFESAPAVDPATTQGEIAQSPEIPAGTTTEQLKQDPRFATAPSQMDLDKLAANKDKAQRKGEMDELERRYKESQIAKNEADISKKAEDIERAKERSLHAEESLRKVYEFEASDIDSEVEQIDLEIKAAKDPEPDVFGETPEVDWSQITNLKAKKLELERRRDDFKNSAKMIGTKPGETRKFSPSGRETSRTTVAGRGAATPAQPAITPPTSANPMEKAIRDSLSQKGVSPEIIEQYIADRKAKGML